MGILQLEPAYRLKSRPLTGARPANLSRWLNNCDHMTGGEYSVMSRVAFAVGKGELIRL